MVPHCGEYLGVDLIVSSSPYIPCFIFFLPPCPFREGSCSSDRLNKTSPPHFALSELVHFFSRDELDKSLDNLGQNDDNKSPLTTCMGVILHIRKRADNVQALTSRTSGGRSTNCALVTFPQFLPVYPSRSLDIVMWGQTLITRC